MGFENKGNCQTLAQSISRLADDERGLVQRQALLLDNVKREMADEQRLGETKEEIDVKIAQNLAQQARLTQSSQNLQQTVEALAAQIAEKKTELDKVINTRPKVDCQEAIDAEHAANSAECDATQMLSTISKMESDLTNIKREERTNVSNSWPEEEEQEDFRFRQEVERATVPLKDQVDRLRKDLDALAAAILAKTTDRASPLSSTGSHSSNGA